MSTLLERYQKEIKPVLMKELGIKNPLQVPGIAKVCVNVGMGSYLHKLGSKDFSMVEENIKLITGQKPVVRKSRKSISNFKVRENQPVGISVTLRGKRAYNFVDKLINVVYPRVRDFRGVATSIFDRDGNCSVGFADHTVFPEITRPEDARRVHGLQITIAFSGKDKEQNQKLLEKFGFPFKK